MKRMIAGTVAVLALVAAAPFVAGAHGDGRKDADQGGRHGEHRMEGHHGSGHAGHRGKVRMMEMIEIYDADDDGSVTQDEIDQWRAERLRGFDADGDGQLSLDEYQALWLDAMREHMVDRFQAHDDDGDGLVTVAEFGERTSHMVMMRDRNDDGVLDMDDLQRGGRGEHAGPARQGAPAEQTESQPGATQQQ